MHKPVRELLAPCGLDCGKCMANPDSRIAALARELRDELGGFAAYAEVFADLNALYKVYPEFAALLDHLADGGSCPSCRSGKCLFQGCVVSRCTAEKDIDYCAECDDFPCAEANLPPHLDVLWRMSTEGIRKHGAEAFYASIKDRPRYPARNKS